MKRKTRKQKELEYQKKYAGIPIDYNERIRWLHETLKITSRKAEEILLARNNMYNFMYYKVFKVILFEEPEGTPRPRFRLINRQNLCNQAMNNGSFVHVYSINAHEDNMFMKRLITEDLIDLDKIIYTPCDVDYNVFVKTPGYFNAKKTILSEIGMIRPMNKPDWDNIGKKYSDMYNGNVWVDDRCVVGASVNKFFSVLPRVEINLKFLNAIYTHEQSKSMKKLLPEENMIYFN